MYKKTRLKNGIRIVKACNRSVETVTLLALFGTGSRDEKGRMEGIAHFLEHTILKGTERRPEGAMINRELDAVGASYNAFTGKECTGFWVKCGRKDFPLALDIISDVILRPLFRDKEVEIEKGPVLEEIKMYEDAPMRNISSVFESLIFKGHDLAHDQLGTADNVKSFSPKDLRSFYRKHYHADNLVLAVSGNFQEEKIDTAIAEKFSEMRKAAGKNRHGKFAGRQSGPEMMLRFKKTDQTNFSLGFRAFQTGHKDEYALDILNVILGGNDSSRLYDKIREKSGLAYYIYSYTADYEDTGYIAIQSGVGNDRCTQAISMVLSEIATIREDGITEEELGHAKNYIRGKMAIALESSSAVADFIAAQEIATGKILTPQEKFDKINAVTAEDVTRVAREIFTEKRLNLALIGPFKNERAFAKILKIQNPK